MKLLKIGYMKTFELIKVLKKLAKQYGDLPIELCSQYANDNTLKELEEVSLTKYSEFSEKPNKVCITLHDFEQ